MVFIQGIDTLLNYEYNCEDMGPLAVRYYSLDKNSVYLALGVRQRARVLIVCHKVGKRIEVSTFQCALGLRAPDVFIFKQPGDSSHVYSIDHITAKVKRYRIPDAFAGKTLEIARPGENVLQLDFTDNTKATIRL